MFTLSEGVDEELVKKCALKKMSLAFATFKKKLFTNYIKKGKEPKWDDLPQVKPYWEEFKQYKLSEEAQGKSEFANGVTLNQSDGSLVVLEQMQEVARDLVTTVDEAKQGTFQPQRENDELTRALKNPEHPR